MYRDSRVDMFSFTLLRLLKTRKRWKKSIWLFLTLLWVAFPPRKWCHF